MSATKERKPRKKAEENGHDEPRARQGHLEGLEPPTIPEIEELAEGFVKARNAWQRRHPAMMEAQTLLHDTMKRHGIRNYQFDDYNVEIVGSEKVRVKAKKDESEDDE